MPVIFSLSSRKYWVYSANTWCMYWVKTKTNTCLSLSPMQISIYWIVNGETNSKTKQNSLLLNMVTFCSVSLSLIMFTFGVDRWSANNMRPQEGFCLIRDFSRQRDCEFRKKGKNYPQFINNSTTALVHNVFFPEGDQTLVLHQYIPLFYLTVRLL